MDYELLFVTKFFAIDYILSILSTIFIYLYDLAVKFKSIFILMWQTATNVLGNITNTY